MSVTTTDLIAVSYSEQSGPIKHFLLHLIKYLWRNDGWMASFYIISGMLSYIFLSYTIEIILCKYFLKPHIALILLILQHLLDYICTPYLFACYHFYTTFL